MTTNKKFCVLVEQFEAMNFGWDQQNNPELRAIKNVPEQFTAVVSKYTEEQLSGFYGFDDQAIWLLSDSEEILNDVVSVCVALSGGNDPRDSRFETLSNGQVHDHWAAV